MPFFFWGILSLEEETLVFSLNWRGLSRSSSPPPSFCRWENTGPEQWSGLPWVACTVHPGEGQPLCSRTLPWAQDFQARGSTHEARFSSSVLITSIRPELFPSRGYKLKAPSQASALGHFTSRKSKQLPLKACSILVSTLEHWTAGAWESGAVCTLLTKGQVCFHYNNPRFSQSPGKAVPANWQHRT